MWPLVFALSIGLHITYPPDLISHIISPLFNYRIGPQATNITIDAELVIALYSQVSRDTVAPIPGKIAVLHNDQSTSKNMKQERDAVEVLQRAGAVAVIRSLYDYGAPG